MDSDIVDKIGIAVDDHLPVFEQGGGRSLDSFWDSVFILSLPKASATDSMECLIHI